MDIDNDKLFINDNLAKLDNDKQSISSTERLNDMLNEADKELSIIQPEMDELESVLVRLQELKKTKQKLITLKLSIQSILNNYTGAKLNKMEENLTESLSFNAKDKLNSYITSPKTKVSGKSVKNIQDELGSFYPDKAFEQANLILKQKNSINYELLRAIVLSGGSASTQVIKDFLLEHDIKLPASGESFAEVALTDISARVNYLIRKGLVVPAGRGVFRVTVGWDGSNTAAPEEQKSTPQ